MKKIFWATFCRPGAISIPDIFERRIARFFCIFLLILAAGCAQLPDVDYTHLRAGDSRDPQEHLDYLRMQSEKQTDKGFSAGNKVKLLRNGKEAFPAMLAAIRSAKQRIDIESFIFDKDEGAHFAKALLERARHKVEINLIYDSYGSGDTPDELFEQMRAGGIRTLEYNPIDPLSIADTSANYRDHRKILIVDGRKAFTGGINISTVYNHPIHKYDKDEDLDPSRILWRDTQIQIEGPAVSALEKLFNETWRDQDGPPPKILGYRGPANAGGERVQIVDGYPEKDRFDIYKSLLLAINLSQKSIHLTTGFFVPPPDLVDALKDAARRGVDVTLLLPGQSDSDLALHAGRSFYDELLRASVHIYERKDAVLHAKTAVVDGVWSTVGSSNLDWRSAVWNNECNAVIIGKSFGEQMEDMFRSDLSFAEKIDLSSWRDRPFLDAVHEDFASFVQYML